MNVKTVIRKLLFHSVTRTAPLQNDTPYIVQLTVFSRTPLRHAMSTLRMHNLPLSDTVIILAGIYLLLQNISEIHLLPTVTA